MKKCSKCGIEYPATTKHFGIARRNTGGLKCICNGCSAIERKIYKSKHKETIVAQNHIYRDKNKEEIKAKNQIYRDKHRVVKVKPLIKEKTCRVCKTVYIAEDDAYFNKKYKGKYGLTTICKECFKKQSKEYYLNNTEGIKKRVTQYYLDNIDKKKAYSSKWHSVYDRTEKGKDVKNAAWERRRALEHNLANDYTTEQWEQCKSDFNSTCAYCGKTEKLTIEHFVPVSKLGELTGNNVLPVCSHCNSSKGNRKFELWYPKQPFYSKQREKKVLGYLKYKKNVQQLALM